MNEEQTPLQNQAPEEKQNASENKEPTVSHEQPDQDKSKDENNEEK